MIEISISRELAVEHPGFLAGCAERGHKVQVFGTSHERAESDAAETRDPDDMPDAAYIGEAEPGAQSFAAPIGPVDVKRRGGDALL